MEQKTADDRKTAEQQAARLKQMEEWDSQLEAERTARLGEEKMSRAKLYATNPADFFTRYLAHNYLVTPKGIRRASPFDAKILQIPNVDIILCNIDSGYGEAETIAVTGYPTEGLFDGAHISLSGIWCGTHRYSSVLGAVKTVRQFQHIGTMTLTEFYKFTNQVNFVQLVEDSFSKAKAPAK